VPPGSGAARGDLQEAVPGYRGVDADSIQREFLPVMESRLRRAVDGGARAAAATGGACAES